MKQNLLFIIFLFVLGAASHAQTLGNYNSTATSAGKNATISPSSTPVNTVAMSVSSSSDFQGIMTARTNTGIVTIIDAKPAGVYTIKVRAFNSAGASTTKTFILTVDIPGCSQGNFSGTTEIHTGPNQLNVVVGDFNRDGKQDLAAAHEGGNNTLSIRMGNGHGGFTGSAELTVGSHPFDVAIGDFDRDGKQDLCVANSGGNHISILLGDGTGGFATNPVVVVGNTPVSLAVTDFNGDNKQDIAVANLNTNTVSVRFGDGHGFFSGNREVAVGRNPFSIVVGDFDNNGKQDIATANSGDNTISVRFGNGSGGFSGTTEVPVGFNPYCVAIGDFNEDGNQDLASASFANNTVSIRLGDGIGNFSGSTEVAAGLNPYCVTTGNFNGDGHLDLAIANYFGNNVSIRLGDGLGNFNGIIEVPAGSYPTCVIAGEFNNDDLMDLAISNLNDRSVSIRLGSSTHPVYSLTSNSPVCVGDDIHVGALGGITYSWTGPNGFNSTLENILIPSSALIDTGYYSVTILDSTGCSGTVKTKVDVNPLPVVNFNLIKDSLCTSDPNLLLSGGSPANGVYTGYAVGSGIFDPSAAGPGDFLLTYTYTDQNNCTGDDKDFVHVLICTDVPETFHKDYLQIFPNPVNSILNFSESLQNFEVFNLYGQIVFSNHTTVNNFSVSEFANGIYFLRADNYFLKFVVEH